MVLKHVTKEMFVSPFAAGDLPVTSLLCAIEKNKANLWLPNTDDQTVESAGLLCAGSDVTVVYARREVEAATKEAIHEEGPLRVIVPSHITEIATAAFENCHQVLMVTIPESVTSIGENAFAGCIGLWHVSLSLSH